MKKIAVVAIVFLLIIGLGFFLNPFRAPGNDKKTEIVTIDTDDYGAAGLKLQDRGFVRSFLGFDIALAIKGKHGKIQPGGYYLSKNMDTWRVIDELTNGPDLKWVTIPEGMRKEQIGEKLKATLGWSDQELENWNNTYTAMKYDYVEGVYFPDTYLIPVEESGLEVTNRMVSRFNEEFAPYLDQFAKKDIIWTTGLRLASIVQREAAGPRDMPLIAGILWNRLLINQKLEVDATVQYARGKTKDGWWSPISPMDIQNIDSPYNTYKHVGLPPHPISNPGISAIKAALNPQETDCLYYLHDHSRQIHCAKTYEEHLENIEEYLR